jgi:hypothetical protein
VEPISRSQYQPAIPLCPIEFHGKADPNDDAEIHDITGGSILHYHSNAVTLLGVSASQFTSQNVSFLDDNSMPTNHQLLIA